MSISGQTYAGLAATIVGKLNQLVGEHDPQEDAIGVLLRLLGMTNKVEEGDSKETFVTSFTRNKDQTSANAKDSFKEYLAGLKDRIEKWKKDTNVARINKIKRLIGEEGEVPDAEITPEDTLDVAVQKIRKFQKNLSDNKDEVGLLTTQAALYNAASDKVDSLVATLPTTEFGNFGSEIIALLKADNNFLTTTSQRLNRRIAALKVELNKLRREEQYISTGIRLDEEQTSTMSLREVVEIMIYLIDKVEYKCKECLYFEGSLCLYGANNLETVPENSCLQVYNREDNPFWRPNDQTVTSVSNFAKGL